MVLNIKLFYGIGKMHVLKTELKNIFRQFLIKPKFASDNIIIYMLSSFRIKVISKKKNYIITGYAQ